MMYENMAASRNTSSKQTFQLSRILRETHAFDIFLTPTRIDTTFSRQDFYASSVRPKSS